MGEFCLTSQSIRTLLDKAYIIKQYHKCLECDGTGYLNWDENGEDIRTGYYNGTDRESGECETCKGVGYLLWE